MKLLDQTRQPGLVQNTFVIDHPTEKILIYNEWVNEKGRVVDFTLQGKTGILYDYLDNVSLIEEVQEFIDNFGMFIDDEEWEKEMGR
jgi:hypothetical protein